MVKFLKPAFFGICLILFGAMYARIGFAVGSYYLDSKKNDRSYTHQSYSQSEVYADASGKDTKSSKSYNNTKANTPNLGVGGIKTDIITNNNKDIDVYKDTTYDGHSKKVYNTIIIRKNKNRKNKNIKNGEKQQPDNKVKVIKTENSDNKIQPLKKREITKRKYDNINLRPEERARRDEEQIEENKRIAEEQAEYKSDTKKQVEEEDNSSTPADWYIYGFTGYSLGLPFWSTFSSAIDNIAQSTTEFPFSHGFHLGAGAKIYGWHFFISPELVYQRFSTTLHSQSDVVDVTKYRTFGTDNWVADGEISAVETKQVVLKNMITGSFRIGLTFGNSLSLYGKANLGIINMSTSMRYTLPQSTINTMTDLEVDSIIHLEKRGYHKDNWGFVYGIGAGIEASMWRQHLFFRFEYNYYFMYAYNKVVIPATIAGGEDKLMKYKSNFGVALFSVGLAF